MVTRSDAARGIAAAAASPLRSVIAGQLLVAALVTCTTLGRLPFWRDEVASVSIAGRGLAAILVVMGKTDANSGLYYFLLHAWMAAVPMAHLSEGWMRVPSALCAIATVPVTTLIAQHLFDRGVAAVAGFVLALNLYFLAYAQEARSYSLAMLLSTLSTFAFIAIMRHPTTYAIIAYTATMVLAIYANLFAILLLAAHIVSLPLVDRERRAGRSFALSLAAIALPTAPFATFVLAQGGRQVSWLPRPTARTLLDFGVQLAAGGPYSPTDLSVENWLTSSVSLLAGLCVLTAIALIARSWRAGVLDTGARHAIVVLVWFGLPPVALLLVSFLKPFFFSRYLIGSLPPLAILVAVGLCAFPRRVMTIAIGGTLACLSVAIFLRSQADPYRLKLEDLRAAAQMVAQESRPGDAIGYAPAFARLGFTYYLARSGVSADRLPDDVALAPHGQPEEVGGVFAKELDAITVSHTVARYQRVWFIGYPDSNWHPTPEPMLYAETAVLAQGYAAVLTRNFGQVRVVLYERK